ncbi:Peroxisome biogenesis protein 19-1 [Grifola frondosa]|uniref:Peroxisome biogenesis protein 19-1 n=1 Tax=Grifola frondosa TaxID=5627 RepID=A0A1C7MTR1_GRIFR|nr:Peroxisome biogenesis protein 19-1 [Grifola frondosa]
MSAPPKTRVNDVDDDLDDLDDVLEQFTPAPAKSQAPVQPALAASSSSSVPAPKDGTASQPRLAKTNSFSLEGLDMTDDFTRELTRGMESLMREISNESGIPAEGTGEAEDPEQEMERQKAFKAAWEAMLIESMNGTLSADDLAGAPKTDREAKNVDANTSPSGGGGTFQSSIQKAMEKLKESDSNLQADASTSGAESLEALLSQLSGELGEGESEEELHTLLDSMMSQLMSKEVLYEPLKELHEKFPSYLKENASKLSAEDKKRYDLQYIVVTKIVAVFDDPTYSDEDMQKGIKVVELMQEMQSHGSPPSEIMGPLPPGLDVGPDGMPKLPEGCTIA